MRPFIVPSNQAALVLLSLAIIFTQTVGSSPSSGPSISAVKPSFGIPPSCSPNEKPSGSKASKSKKSSKRCKGGKGGTDKGGIRRFDYDRISVPTVSPGDTLVPDKVAPDPIMFIDTSTIAPTLSPVDASLPEKAAMKFTGNEMDEVVETDGGDPYGNYRSQLPNGIQHTASSNAAPVTASALLLIVGSTAFLI
jgi:hypothetical protein